MERDLASGALASAKASRECRESAVVGSRAMEGAPTSGGRGARFWLIVVLVALAVIFAAVNFQKVTIDFVVGEANAPLVVALLISGALGFIIGLALPRLRRRD
jgi:uncharacterized integral membrane protein